MPVQLEARDGLVPRLDGTSLGVFHADDSQSSHEYYPQLRLVIKAPQMLLPNHRKKNIFSKRALYSWIITVFNNLTKISCSDVTDLSGDMLGCPCLWVIRVEQGRAAEFRELSSAGALLPCRPVLPLSPSGQAPELNNSTVGWKAQRNNTPDHLRIELGRRWWHQCPAGFSGVQVTGEGAVPTPQLSALLHCTVLSSASDLGVSEVIICQELLSQH